MRPIWIGELLLSNNKSIPSSRLYIYTKIYMSIIFKERKVVYHLSPEYSVSSQSLQCFKPWSHCVSWHCVDQTARSLTRAIFFTCFYPALSSRCFNRDETRHAVILIVATKVLGTCHYEFKGDLCIPNFTLSFI